MKNNQPKYEEFRGKLCIITSVRGSKYIGIVSGFRRDQTCLSHKPDFPAVILTKDGKNWKASPKNGLTRWFNNSSILSLEEGEYPCSVQSSFDTIGT